MTACAPDLQEADGTLVRDGRVRRGAFRTPFRTPGFEAVDLTGLGPCVPFLRLRQRFWFGYAVNHPDVYLATIAIDLGVATVSALYFFERATGTYGEHTAFTLDPRRGRVATSPWDDRSLVEAPGHRVAYRHWLDRSRHEVSIDVAASRDAPAVRAEVVMHEDLATVAPLVASLPATGRWFMYTHKAHAPGSGFVRVGDREYRLDPARDLVNLDEHKAAYPYRQEWTWGTFGGRDATGRILAANLCTNRHYTDDAHGNENRLWIGSRLDPLGAASFDFDPADPARPWTVGESGGRLDLVFAPDGLKRQRTGLGPYRLDYFQAYGRWRGRVVDAEGASHEIRDFYGVCERGIGRN